MLGVYEQILQDPLAGAVVSDQLHQAVTFGRSVLRMGTDIEVEPGTITKEHVRATAPGNYPAEQIPGHLVRTQPTVTVERARHPEFGLDPHDSSLHPIDITAE
ncbi:hypothetical protein GCM10027262_54980 [Nocardia tengchongensis]